MKKLNEHLKFLALIQQVPILTRKLVLTQLRFTNELTFK